MNATNAGAENTASYKPTSTYEYDKYGRRIYSKAQQDVIYAEFAKRHPLDGKRPPLDISGLPTREEMDKLADELFGKQKYAPPTNASKMTYDDYINAWQNKDWKTTAAYSAAVKNGTIAQPQATASQMMRLSDINMQNTPDVVKNILSFFPGLSNGLTLGTDQLKNGQSNNPTAQAYAHTTDNLKKNATIGYGLGEGAGQALAALGLGALFGAPVTSASSGSLLRQAVPWGAANGLQTLVSDASQGKSGDQAAGDTLASIGLGILGGGVGKYLGDTLPQAGTLAYQKMLQDGGLLKAIAPAVSRIAAALNPEGAEAANAYGVGNVANDRYNIMNDPLRQNDLMPYRYFEKQSPPGDDLFGHELWQHANLKANGLAKARLSTDVSKNNPVIALDGNTHNSITMAQHGLDARNQSPLDNIIQNHRILVEHGVPEDIADWLQDWAIQHLEKNGGKG